MSEKYNVRWPKETTDFGSIFVMEVIGGGAELIVGKFPNTERGQMDAAALAYRLNGEFKPLSSEELDGLPE